MAGNQTHFLMCDVMLQYSGSVKVMIEVLFSSSAICLINSCSSFSYYRLVPSKLSTLSVTKNQLVLLQQETRDKGVLRDTFLKFLRKMCLELYLVRHFEFGGDNVLRKICLGSENLATQIDLHPSVPVSYISIIHTYIIYKSMVYRRFSEVAGDKVFGKTCSIPVYPTFRIRNSSVSICYTILDPFSYYYTCQTNFKASDSIYDYLTFNFLKTFGFPESFLGFMRVVRTA